MTKTKILNNRRIAKNSIRISNRNRNCLKWSKNETFEHIFRKFQIAYVLSKQGKEFYSECIFENGSRADLINSDELIIYEVYHTEKPEKSTKELYYPPIFEIRFVSAGGEFTEVMIE